MQALTYMRRRAERPLTRIVIGAVYVRGSVCDACRPICLFALPPTPTACAHSDLSCNVVNTTTTTTEHSPSTPATALRASMLHASAPALGGGTPGEWNHVHQWKTKAKLAAMKEAADKAAAKAKAAEKQEVAAPKAGLGGGIAPLPGEKVLVLDESLPDGALEEYFASLRSGAGQGRQGEGGGAGAAPAEGTAGKPRRGKVKVGGLFEMVVVYDSGSKGTHALLTFTLLVSQTIHTHTRLPDAFAVWVDLQEERQEADCWCWCSSSIRTSGTRGSRRGQATAAAAAKKQPVMVILRWVSHRLGA